MEDHAEGELGGEEGEEPLRGVHVGLQVQLLEVAPQLWKLLLKGWENKGDRRERSDRKGYIKYSIELDIRHRIKNIIGYRGQDSIYYSTYGI